jgi:hypothetical protein
VRYDAQGDQCVGTIAEWRALGSLMRLNDRFRMVLIDPGAGWLAATNGHALIACEIPSAPGVGAWALGPDDLRLIKRSSRDERALVGVGRKIQPELLRLWPRAAREQMANYDLLRERSRGPCDVLLRPSLLGPMMRAMARAALSTGSTGRLGILEDMADDLVQVRACSAAGQAQSEEPVPVYMFVPSLDGSCAWRAWAMPCRLSMGSEGHWDRMRALERATPYALFDQAEEAIDAALGAAGA